MEGIGLVTYASSLITQLIDELTHAELLSNRISELEDKVSKRSVGMGDSKQY
jgi:hypothetical protein